MRPAPTPAPMAVRIVRRGLRVASPSEVPAMSVLPVLSAVQGHQPWPSDRIAALSDRGVLARAATLLGLPTRELPLPLRWAPGPAQIAALRTTAEVLLTRLEQNTEA